MSAAGGVPTGTYRVQLGPGHGFAETAAQLDYLARLGVSHVYLSPVLQATPGSTHGYDVVDHSRLSDDLGGPMAFDALAGALAARDLGAIADVVPNHMAVPVPESLNLALWSVLRDGPHSPYAAWFDVEWEAQQQAILLPVLGRRIGECLDDGELVVEQRPYGPVLRYFAHEFPVRPGTEQLPLVQLLDAQHYRLAFWRVGDDELNYRRFFDIDALLALRTEDPAVLAETHAVLLALVAEGRLQGLRVDHPDGLADPRGYLRRLAEATDGAWVVVEKILEGDEALPADWPCAGTTGYDVLRVVGGLFVDPAGEAPLRALHARATGQPDDWPAVSAEARRHVATRVLRAEVERLADLAAALCERDVRRRDHTRTGLRLALVETLVAMPVYRAYVVPGEDAPAESVTILEQAAAAAREVLPDRAAEVDVVRDLALGRFGRGSLEDQFVVRFQQTCGPVMAKGVEDTAFYRWAPLLSLAEVGGNPAEFGCSPTAFHAFAARQLARHPDGMTTLSTHDTKRSEDARARLAVLAERPDEWAATHVELEAAARRHRSTPNVPDGPGGYQLWQTLVGVWPINSDRLRPYLVKSAREAKTSTSWQHPDDDYERALLGYAASLLADSAVTDLLDRLVTRLAPHAAVNTLGQKLVQLTMPGVPDVYQGCEVVSRRMVDPDNRQPVDHASLGALLDAVDADQPLGTLADDATLSKAKLRVTATALRLRRQHPDWFGAAGGYRPVGADGPAADHLVAFVRGAALTIATRLPHGLERDGGWQDTTVELPGGTWCDLITGREHTGRLRVAELLDRLPVALLARDA